jgi:ABC-type lipoprotein release transport system permease subunit
VKSLAIAGTGVAAAVLHPLRSVVTVACVATVLAPYVAGLGLSLGLEDLAAESVRAGPDLHVAGRRLGRDVPVPVAAAEKIRAIPGVVSVVPRIVGEVTLGRDGVSAVLVGVPRDALPAQAAVVDGRLFSAEGGQELVVGSRLARRLALRPGAKIPPFYRNPDGERVSTVVGVFRSGAPLWEANVVLASLETASAVFGQRGLATSLLVTCAPGYADEVRELVLALPSLAADDGHGPLRARVLARGDLEAELARGFRHRGGVFTLHLILAFAVGIPLVLVTSGVGLTERRRETGLLKATGWQTDEVLLRAGAESLLLAAAGAALAVLVAFAWLRGLRGAGLAPLFFPGLDATPDVVLPFRLAPEPVLVASALSFVIVAAGTLLSSWRAASASPAEAMR